MEKSATDEARQLGAKGVSNKLGELADGLDQMLDECRPSTEVRTVVKSLLSLIDQHDDATAIAISLGDEEPEPEKAMKTKKYGRKGVDDQEDMDPKDPVRAEKDDATENTPTIPVGAQFLGGMHDHHTKAAEYFADNIKQLEPETAEKFAPHENNIMKCLKSAAELHNERYPDLPGLDGADWQDPDEEKREGEEEVEEGEEKEGEAEEKEGEEKELDAEEGEEEKSTDEEADKDDDAGDSENDDGKPAEDEKFDKEKKGDGDETSEEEDEDEDTKKVGKVFTRKEKRAVGLQIKAFLKKSEDRILARTKLVGPTADEVVKATALFLKGFAADTRQNSGRREQANVLRSKLLKTIKPIGQVAPTKVETVDSNEVMAHFARLTKTLSDDVREVVKSLAEVKKLNGE